MAKYHRIKWRESDEKELTKAINNFNAKIRRLSKTDPKLANVLPEKVSKRDLKNLIDTRRDLNREINSLRRFTERGAEALVDIPNSENNLKITKWQRTEMLRRVAVINRRRKARLEKLENYSLSSRGEPLGYKLGDIGMGSETEVSLSPMNAFTPSMQRIDVKEKYKTILKESQNDYFTKKDFRLKENYIKALNQNFNPKDVKDIVEKIKDMNINEFLDKFYSEDDKFDQPYPPNQEQYEAYLNSLKATWTPNKKP